MHQEKKYIVLVLTCYYEFQVLEKENGFYIKRRNQKFNRVTLLNGKG
jgi:hypothetical protein